MKIIFSILAASALVSCSEPLPDLTNEHHPKVVVRFTVGIDQAEPQSRATDEDRVADVNLFLANTATKQVLQVYTRSNRAQFTCLPGCYELYAIANIHADTGDLSYDELRGYAVQQPQVQEDLVMTDMRLVNVPPTEGLVDLEPVTLHRFASKIIYDVRISQEPATDGIRLDSVQAMCVPMRASLFDGSKPVTYTDGPFIAVPEGQNNLAGMFYMLPNCQGTVAGITDPRQKNPEHAPQFATHLRIRARRGGSVLDYYVYLGDNDTSDFNVRANTQHTLHITIRGDRDTEVRMRHYEVGADLASTTPPQDGFLLAAGCLDLKMWLSGDYQNMELSAVLEVLEGDAKHLYCEGQPLNGLYHFTLRSADERIRLDYAPPIFNSSSALLRLRLRIYDRYGPVFTLDSTFRYAYLLTVYTSWYDLNGRIGCTTCAIASDDATTVRGGSLSSTFYKVYAPAEGCTLRALPDVSGHRLDGWYAQYNLLGLLGREDTLHYVPDPAAAEREIYAYFH